MLKAVIEASNEAIAMSDREGQLAYANPAHERLFGRPLGRTESSDYRECYPPPSLSKY